MPPKRKKEHEAFMFCCGCGLAVKTSKLFIKQYHNTAICLCKRCALILVEQINNKYTEEGE